ncbi:hypothetical protein ACFJIX_29085 [Roseateles sp. UC29_93]|uniref:hypothetical protein n=1 Tax=Roseateles sp. UC29_93 TaxID=3350177 RepID=UPI00366D9941
MKQDVRWFAVAREDLIDVLLGEEEPRGGGALSPADLELRHGALALGYRPLSYGARTASQPTAVVIPDNSAVETLSWLRVYAEEAFPISQFARVARLTDWDIFGRIGSSTSEYSFRPERWASVAVGETLAQADSEVDLQAMPLSRIASSLSLPVGRTASLFGHGEPTRVCVDRLRILCDDARLGRRAIGVDHLAPIWALCTATVAGHLEPHEAAQLVVDACIAHLRDSAPNARLQDVEFLSRFPGLRSDSVEHRVMAFTELAQAIAALPAVELGGLGATLLAAGCFMVGRSTSHAFLLNRFQKLAPTAFAWFGLMAALAGPRAWTLLGCGR